ncbi:adenylylsulfate kinase [Bacillus cereus VD115]|nr:adenylylsulfate kinase [Bacillus cereus VD115]
MHKHKSCIVWFTSLSGFGTSTIVNIFESKLHQLGISTYILDGDNLLKGSNQDLSFSVADRKENIHLVGEVSKLFVDCGVIVLATFISPYRSDREAVRKNVSLGEFIEVYVDCSLENCEKRDPKGLYKRARNGEIQEITLDSNHCSAEA